MANQKLPELYNEIVLLIKKQINTFWKKYKQYYIANSLDKQDLLQECLYNILQNEKKYKYKDKIHLKKLINQSIRWKLRNLTRDSLHYKNILNTTPQHGLVNQNEYIDINEDIILDKKENEIFIKINAILNEQEMAIFYQKFNTINSLRNIAQKLDISHETCRKIYKKLIRKIKNFLIQMLEIEKVKRF